MLLITFVRLAFQVYIWLIIIRVILSWFRMPFTERLGPILVFIYDITEPVLAFFRNLMPSVMIGGAGIDFSPIVAILVLQLLQSLVIRLLLAI